MIQLMLLNITGADTLQPGEYAVEHSDCVPAAAPVITLCCPLCSAKHDLTEVHHVADNGRVSPAFQCPTCPFLEWLRLTSWEVVR